MDRAAVARIRESYSLMQPRSEELVTRFHDRLFRAQPVLRMLFPSDVTQQKRQFADVLRLIVAHAEHMDNLRDMLRNMGAKHVEYGAKPEHYPVVRDLLVATMAEITGSGWSAQLAHDWTSLISRVAEMMLEGAESRMLSAA